MRLYIRRPELADTFGRGAPAAQDKRDGRWYMAKSLPQYGLSGWVERAWHAWLVFTDRARAVEFMCDRPNAGYSSVDERDALGAGVPVYHTAPWCGRCRDDIGRGCSSIGAGVADTALE